jgi:hypothetical protein
MNNFAHVYVIYKERAGEDGGESPSSICGTVRTRGGILNLTEISLKPHKCSACMENKTWENVLETGKKTPCTTVALGPSSMLHNYLNLPLLFRGVKGTVVP